VISFFLDQSTGQYEDSFKVKEMKKLREDLYYVYAYFISGFVVYHYSRTQNPLRMLGYSCIGLILAFCLDGYVGLCQSSGGVFYCHKVPYLFGFYTRSILRGFCEAGIWFSTLIFVESWTTYLTKARFLGFFFGITNCSKLIASSSFASKIWSSIDISAYADNNTVLSTLAIVGITAAFTLNFRSGRRQARREENLNPNAMSTIKLVFTTPFEKHHYLLVIMGWVTGYMYLTNTYMLDHGYILSESPQSITMDYKVHGAYNERWVLKVSRDVTTILGPVLVGIIADNYKNNTRLITNIMKIYIFAYIPLALASSFNNFYLFAIANILLGFAYTALSVVVLVKIAENFTEKVPLFVAYQAANLSMKIFISVRGEYFIWQMVYISYGLTALAFVYIVYENLMAVYNLLFKGKEEEQRQGNLGGTYDIYRPRN